jgi:UDP-4-amino-4,6-dideoxy-N-acetyl-beta-L-altrosamine N-acetyltransferase
MLKRSDYCLRNMIEGDLAQVLVWRNSDRIRSCMYTDNIITLEEHHNWYSRTLGNPNVANMILEFQGQPIGVASATQIDRHHGKCLWGVYLGDTAAPKGSSYVMGLLFLTFIFNDLSLRKVCGEVLAFNTDSLNFHRNLGFEQEGVLKEHVSKQETYVDVIIFGLLSKRWPEERSKIENRLFVSI